MRPVSRLMAQALMSTGVHPLAIRQTRPPPSFEEIRAGVVRIATLQCAECGAVFDGVETEARAALVDHVSEAHKR